MLAYDYPLLGVFWSLLFLFMFVAVGFIVVYTLIDNFRRSDHSGPAKAVWALFIIVFPLVGALIYIAMRPKVTAQDVEMMTRMEAGAKAAAAVSPADQIAKLQELKAAGAISDAEFESLKQKAMSS